ncbi:MAG TPA: redoxin domain-containing protein [Candidatus Brocadiia bacterium]|nr:redoxin domain-containing protein [Candidatus Brocadiia bacterium]
MRTAFAVTVALALTTALGAWRQAAAEPKAGSVAPEISAAKWFNTEGEVSLAKLKGKIVVVEFWATWCPPCRRSIPHINEIQKKYADKGVVIIGLSNEPASKVEPFIKQMNAGAKKQMEYIVGAESKDGDKYGVRGIPHAFIVGPDGKVLWSGHPMDGMDKQIEKAVAQWPATPAKDAAKEAPQAAPKDKKAK